jgi:hypothetical protein
MARDLPKNSNKEKGNAGCPHFLNNGAVKKLLLHFFVVDIVAIIAAAWLGLLVLIQFLLHLLNSILHLIHLPPGRYRDAKNGENEFVQNIVDCKDNQQPFEDTSHSRQR